MSAYERLKKEGRLTPELIELRKRADQEYNIAVSKGATWYGSGGEVFDENKKQSESANRMRVSRKRDRILTRCFKALENGGNDYTEIEEIRLVAPNKVAKFEEKHCVTN